ncbi:MAG: division/cell wall cluster transcriptional repressor MraZ [Acidobacteria bacterium]|nr:MAG: division/cell wall cluster transcriptional repressor MraZ [Acidobacteriota bacterium]
MLRGNYPARVDEKGRLKLPTEFRAQLDESNPEHRFYITSFDGAQSRIYPMPVWEAIEQKLAALPSMHPTKQKLLSRTNYYGQVVEMDGQGRLLIPSVLREAAEMRGDVAVLGYLQYLEVWNEQRLLADMKAKAFTDEDKQTLADLGI